MQKMGYRIITSVLLLAWMGVIFHFSAQPAGQSEKVSGSVAYRILDVTDQAFQMQLSSEELQYYAKKLDYPIRKAAHMTEYAIMALLSFTFYSGFGKPGNHRYLLAWLTAVLYAASDEFHQLFVAGRSGQISDVCIDAIGAAIGLLLLCLMKNILGKRCEKKQLPLQ